MSNFMRLLIFFDLPVKTKKERREATQFRNFLLKDGFYMVQFSLYGRVCNTIETAQLHENHVILHLPTAGSVRSLIVTEKQYASMRILVGVSRKKEAPVKAAQLSFF